MSKYVVATWGEWNLANYEKFFSQNEEFTLITTKEDLTKENLDNINPEYIFFPHWSHIIPKSVYENFNCVVFHMTDLPFGRGGSPLQNLIVRGIEDTKITALKVSKGLDTGPIYFKEELSLKGTAHEIFLRTSQIVFEKMIPKFLENKLEPTEQSGEVVEFKRRRPEDGCLNDLSDIDELYDYIRMLDAPGYPNAFIEINGKKINFTNAEIVDGKIKGNVEICISKEGND
jgi:methionyl-tRNA formyltransferase